MNQPGQNPRHYFFPDPPTTSGPAQQQPFGYQGNSGVIYGTQQRAVWHAGENDERQVLDITKAQALWRVSLFGPFSVTIQYGTQGTHQILSLLAPVVMTFPGQVTITAKPLSAEGERVCVVTLTQATAGARSIARKLANAGAGPAVTLDPDAVDFFALNACTLTISGVAVAVPALSVVPLVSGSVLNTGAGFQEFEA